jgi:hypothetical protein
MAKRLVLAAQLPEPPEPLELELPSGKLVLATPLAALSSEQQRSMMAQYRRLVAAQHQLRGAKDQASQSRAGIQLLEIISQLTRVFVPTIADEDLARLTPEQQLAIIQWWIEEHPELKHQATANQPLNTIPPSQKTALPSSPRGSFGHSSKATQRRFGKRRNG